MRPPRTVVSADGEVVTELDCLGDDELAEDHRIERSERRRTRRWQTRADVWDAEKRGAE